MLPSFPPSPALPSPADSPQVKEFILEKVAASKRRREEAGDRIRFVIMDMSPVTDIDSSAMHVLGERGRGQWGAVGRGIHRMGLQQL